jgi:hypothetical protein
VVNLLFKGHRTLLDIAVGDSVLQAYTDPDTGRSLSGSPLWLGWDAGSLTLLAD